MPRRFVWLAVLILLLVAVLSPLPGQQPDALLPRTDGAPALPVGWLADGLRNLVLFVPVGALLVASGRTRGVATAMGLALSSAVELLQLVIPGRFASPLDLVANTVGTGLGAALAEIAQYLIRPSRELATRLSLAASGASVGVLLAAAWLLQPSFPAGTYFGGWTLELGHLAWYRGRVLEARVGGAAIGAFGPVSDSDALRLQLQEGAPVVVRWIVGPPPPGLAPLLTIHDQDQRELLLVGIDGADIVLRSRLHASALGLETPSLRLRGALSRVREGELVGLTVTSDGPTRHVAFEGRRSVPLARTPGRSWALLVQHPILSAPLAWALDLCWIALLVFPASFWARHRPVCWVGVGAFFLTLAVLPRLDTTGPSPPLEWIAALTGLSAALWCSRAADDRSLAGPGE